MTVENRDAGWWAERRRRGIRARVVFCWLYARAVVTCEWQYTGTVHETDRWLVRVIAGCLIAAFVYAETRGIEPFSLGVGLGMSLVFVVGERKFSRAIDRAKEQIWPMPWAWRRKRKPWRGYA